MQKLHVLIQFGILDRHSSPAPRCPCGNFTLKAARRPDRNVTGLVYEPSCSRTSREWDPTAKGEMRLNKGEMRLNKARSLAALIDF